MIARAFRSALAALAFGCSSSATPVAGPDAELGGSVVAVAGAISIDATLVARVAQSSEKTPREAVDALVFDAVLAQGASARKLDRDDEVREAQRSVRARLVTDHITRDAAARGAPTDDEVERATARHWREVDLPERMTAVHVVVINNDPQKQAHARAVADDLRRAVLAAKDADDFIARAKQVDAQGLKVQPELLGTFAADGRVVEGGTFDTAFVTAAFALSPGETSGIVQTKFGLHVIRALERLPAKRVPLEERRARFADEINVFRGHDAYVALLTDAKRRHPVVVDPAADALMASATAP